MRKIEWIKADIARLEEYCEAKTSEIESESQPGARKLKIIVLKKHQDELNALREELKVAEAAR